MPPEMTLKDAMAFVIDYGKFIATLWNGYVVFTVAVIGWLVTFSKDGPWDITLRKIIVSAYLLATLIFGVILAYNALYLLKLHDLLHALAESHRSDKAVQAYLTTLGTEKLEPMLVVMFVALVVVALLAAWVMWFIASLKKPATPAT